MTTTSSRRAFLFGRGTGQAPIRPPWAMPEPLFLDACERCDDCVRACEEGIIRRGAGGFPQLSFEDTGCTLCGDCHVACHGRALTADPVAHRPWGHGIEIGGGCLPRAGVECRVCGEACDSGAIRFRPRVGAPALPALQSERCTGCGQCLSRCPVAAIAIARQTAQAADNASQRNEPSEYL